VVTQDAGKPADPPKTNGDASAPELASAPQLASVPELASAPELASVPEKVPEPAAAPDVQPEASKQSKLDIVTAATEPEQKPVDKLPVVDETAPAIEPIPTKPLPTPVQLQESSKAPDSGDLPAQPTQVESSEEGEIVE
jgi:hypothetical protein